MDHTRPKPDDEWLRRHSSREWLELAIAELGRAQDGFRQRNSRAGVMAAKRAAGMALNGALCTVPNDDWGRTYVEHLVGLSRTPGTPAPVVAAAESLLGAEPATTGLVLLWSGAKAEAVLEACRTVMAHAYAIIHGSVGRILVAD